LERVVLDLGIANAKQLLFYRSRALYTAYGGAKGGGKTHAVRVKAVAGAARYPGIRILILRRTYPELQQNHIEPMLRLVPTAAASYNASLRTLYFRNGSIIKFGHYNSASSGFAGGISAELEYQGQEYDWIFMDEATQFTERDFRYLGGCLRGTNMFPKRFYVTCNPGGVGHAWVKRLFIDRDFRAGENPDDYNFIFASAEDNTQLLKASPLYLQMLDAMPENLVRAYRHGDWNSLGGQYFTEFSPERHRAEPFDIPADWTRYRSFDYGLDMLACLWIAEAPDGRAVVYRELRRPNLVVSEAARAIRDATPPGEHIAATFAPPDMWNRQKDTGRTMAEIFMQNGISLIRAGNSRASGHMRIKEFLRQDIQSGTSLSGTDNSPAISFFGSCPGLLRDIAAIQVDARNPNDCARVPHDVTHAVDALRYYCASRSPYVLDEQNIADEYDDVNSPYSPAIYAPDMYAPIAEDLLDWWG
jgi:phage terminase large subunit